MVSDDESQTAVSDVPVLRKPPRRDLLSVLVERRSSHLSSSVPRRSLPRRRTGCTSNGSRGRSLAELSHERCVLGIELLRARLVNRSAWRGEALRAGSAGRSTEAGSSLSAIPAADSQPLLAAECTEGNVPRHVTSSAAGATDNPCGPVLLLGAVVLAMSNTCANRPSATVAQ